MNAPPTTGRTGHRADADIEGRVEDWFADDSDVELWEALGWTREQLIDWVRDGGQVDADDFWEYIADTLRDEDERVSGRTDEPRAEPGRGPGALGRWYHLSMYGRPGTAAEVWVGRYVGFTTAGLPKTEHLLHFVTREGRRRTIRYGALQAAVPAGGLRRRDRLRAGQ